ncbi:MAG: hypothetical protein C0631_13895 [Sedimenticola sp.]|jgi:hypothetical protein|nr:MAG: hypothetical protein C0631_13895 [Sedimenticola sp.]
MPYFIYNIDPKKQLTYLDNNPNYREAREQARGLRAAQAEDDKGTIKIVFAQNQNEAERLLQATREAPVIGDD